MGISAVRLHKIHAALPPLADCAGRLEADFAALTQAFPGEENAVYLRQLTRGVLPSAPQSDTSDSSPAPPPSCLLQATARVGALALLLPLLSEAAIPTDSLTLCRDAHKRPYLAGADGTPVPGMDFNISHAERHIACALLVWESDPSATPLPPLRVGIDIEEPVSPARAERLIARYCTAGEKAALATHALGFTAIWTCREAIAKQQGAGMPLRYDATCPPKGLLLQTERLTEGTVITVAIPDMP